MKIPLDIIQHHIFPSVTNKGLVLVSRYCYEKYRDKLYFGVELDIDKFTQWCNCNNTTEASKFIAASLTRNWETMMRIACNVNSISIMRILLSYPVDITDKYPITAACHGEKLGMIDLLLQDDRFFIDNYILSSCVSMNKLVTMKRLLKDLRVNPSVNNNELYKLAVSKGHTEMVKLLIQDINVRRLKNNNPARYYILMEYPIGTYNVICEMCYGKISKWNKLIKRLNTLISTYCGTRHSNDDMFINYDVVEDVVYLSKEEVKLIFTGLGYEVPPLILHQLK